MLKDVQTSDVIDPVTALALIQCHCGPLLLVGEGTYVKIINHESAQLLACKRVFDIQSLHGIATSKGELGYDRRDRVIEVLFWGGRWLRFGQLRIDINDDLTEIGVDLEDGVQADDWILDAALQPVATASKQDDPVQSEANAVLVTAQNAVLALLHGQGGCPVPTHIASGPKSMLYSAHIEWTDGGRILIASGTVFGEVLLWSLSNDALSSNTGLPASIQLHHRFNGHEGSVFGVRISPSLSGLKLWGFKRLLASCSDDRTIRVWDISDLAARDIFPKSHTGLHGALPDTKGITELESSSRCVAVIMGHQSRIWDVKFLAFKDEINIVSFGEDGTAQVWQLAKVPLSQKLTVPGERSGQNLIHQYTYAYHSGKNIWASAVIRKRDDTYMICTGGADGRVVSYDIDRSSNSLKEGSSSGQWAMQNVTKQLNENESEVDINACGTQQTKRTICSQIFALLEGLWTIDRDIRSVLPTYPSGIFVGEARFERRPQSEGRTATEYLYSENGTFSTEQGLSFPATRQYVYRYQHASDTISAWFVKADNQSTVDYLFHELHMDPAGEQSVTSLFEGENKIIANGYHLCVEDHYTPNYNFSFKDGVLQHWSLSYQVNGPQKDYRTETKYLKQNHEDFQAAANELKEKLPSLEPFKKEEDLIKSDKLVGKDSFKTYMCLDLNSFLATTVQGKVILGTLVPLDRRVGKEKLEWRFMDQFDALKSSSVGTRATGSGLIFIGGDGGTIFRYDSQKTSLHPVSKMDRKIAFLHCQYLQMQTADNVDHLLLAVGLGLSVAHVYSVGLISTGSESHFQLRPHLLAFPESWVVTSAHFVEPLRIWMLGFRHGALAFYDAAHFSIHHTSAPLDVQTDAHGSDAVTAILPFPGETNRHQATQFVLTTGRDGHYGVHSLTSVRTTTGKLRLEIHTVHRSAPPFGPNIEGATFDQQTCDLILWGFRSKGFIVWNASNNMETMTVECGGAHRNWYYTPRSDGSDGGIFVWTKASICNVHMQTSASHRVLQSGGHGREIKAMAMSPVINNGDGFIRQYIATGAEDTAIRIWSYESDQFPRSGFKCLATLTKHTTGIQQLHWSADGGVLFSAAGREEFFVWRVQPLPFLGIGVVCKATGPAVTEDGDLRIMDFALEEIGTDGVAQHRTGWEYDISIVYSDGSLRLYRYTLTPFRNSFEFVQSGTYNTVNCLTQVSYLGAHISLFACTASSDGHLAFWRIPHLFTTEDPAGITCPSKERNAVSEPLIVTDKFLQHSHHVLLHQNYIKSMVAISIEFRRQFLIVSSGDDGALGIIRVTFGLLTHEPQYEKILIPKAHAAAINALAYVGKEHSGESKEEGHVRRHIFMSSGGDQRVKTWAVTINSGPYCRVGMDAEVVGDRHTSVADVAALAVSRIGRRVTVFVAGVGMECFDEDGLGEFAED